MAAKLQYTVKYGAALARHWTQAGDGKAFRETIGRIEAMIAENPSCGEPFAQEMHRIALDGIVVTYIVVNGTGAIEMLSLEAMAREPGTNGKPPDDGWEYMPILGDDDDETTDDDWEIDLNEPPIDVEEIERMIREEPLYTTEEVLESLRKLES